MKEKYINESPLVIGAIKFLLGSLISDYENGVVNIEYYKKRILELEETYEIMGINKVSNIFNKP